MWPLIYLREGESFVQNRNGNFKDMEVVRQGASNTEQNRKFARK